MTELPKCIIMKRKLAELKTAVAHEVHRSIYGRIILRPEIDLSKGVLNGRMRDWNGGYIQMANILKRFGDIMSANINALLDKAEDPEKMIDKCIKDIEEDMRNVKAETAAVMAAETKAKRELTECQDEIAKMQKYAEKALVAGNESDARRFLEKKAELSNKQTALQQSYDLASANAAKMKEMHDKLAKDLEGLQAKRDAIKAKAAVAKTQEKLNKMGSSVSGAGEAMAAFDRMEAKVDRMLDEANAMSELNSETDSIDALAAKYDEDKDSSSVDDELAALKAKMGL